jgi:hypothetical protein
MSMVVWRRGARDIRVIAMRKNFVEAMERRQMLSATVAVSGGDVLVTNARHVQVDEVSPGELQVTDFTTGETTYVQTNAAGGFRSVRVDAGRNRAAVIRVNTVDVDGVVVGSNRADAIAVFVGRTAAGTPGSATVRVSAGSGDDGVLVDADRGPGDRGSGGRVYVDGGSGWDTVHTFAAAVTYVQRSAGQDTLVDEVLGGY